MKTGTYLEAPPPAAGVAAGAMPPPITAGLEVGGAAPAAGCSPPGQLLAGATSPPVANSVSAELLPLREIPPLPAIPVSQPLLSPITATTTAADAADPPIAVVSIPPLLPCPEIAMGRDAGTRTVPIEAAYELVMLLSAREII